MVGRFADIFKRHVRRRLVIYGLVMTAFIAGVVFGARAMDQVSEEGRLALMPAIEALLETSDVTPTPADIVLRRALGDYVLKLLGVIALLGLSVIGAPLVLAVVFVRGFALGFATMFLVDRFMVRGLLLAVAALLPQNLLAVPAIVAAGAGAVSFSVAAARVLLGRRDINMYRQFAASGMVLVFSGVALVAAAFVEAYVSPVLLDIAVRFLL